MPNIWNDAQIESLLDKLHAEATFFRWKNWVPVIAISLGFLAISVLIEEIHPSTMTAGILYLVGLGVGRREALGDVAAELEGLPNREFSPVPGD